MRALPLLDNRPVGHALHMQKYASLATKSLFACRKMELTAATSMMQRTRGLDRIREHGLISVNKLLTAPVNNIKNTKTGAYHLPVLNALDNGANRLNIKWSDFAHFATTSDTFNMEHMVKLRPPFVICILVALGMAITELVTKVCRYLTVW